jgi:hypothetical protein
MSGLCWAPEPDKPGGHVGDRALSTAAPGAMSHFRGPFTAAIMASQQLPEPALLRC